MTVVACPNLPEGVPGAGRTRSELAAADSAASLIRIAAELFRGAGIGSARLDAELLLAEALGTERLQLLVDPRRRVAPAERERFAELALRRSAREPAAYLLGRKEFWGLELEVGPGVLVPRPETELLVETAVRRRRRGSLGTVVDLCCGAAPLALALALELGPRRLLAVDLSPEALSYARRNVRRHGLERRVSLVAGDVLDPFGPALGEVDLIVSNPPYIPSAEVELTMPEVREHEPRLALDGGRDGLALSERILRAAASVLAPGGAVLLETGAGLMDGLLARARAAGLGRFEVLRDLAGHERALWAEREAR
jgi:release factor glutamine methyltransferase